MYTKTDLRLNPFEDFMEGGTDMVVLIGVSDRVGAGIRDVLMVIDLGSVDMFKV